MNIITRYTLLTLTGITTGVLIISMMNMFVVEIGQEIKDLNTVIGLQRHVQEKNLSVPFPDMITTSSMDTRKQYRDLFSQDLMEFHKDLRRHYRYENGTYDCKYWSYIWTLYHKENKERYDWKLDYITTSNHVFVMVRNDEGYCIMDQRRLDCTPGMQLSVM